MIICKPLCFVGAVLGALAMVVSKKRDLNFWLGFWVTVMNAAGVTLL